jgi:DNA-binding XRE family transcriptional regulator
VQLDRTARLVKRLKSHCEENQILQKTLASQLGLSPQGIFEIFKGNNSPSSETALHIVEIIEPQFMSIIVDPPKLPRQAAGNPGQPKTLTEARERIEVLEAQLTQLRGAAAQPAFTVPTPAAKPKLAGSGADPSPTFPPITTPGANQPNTNPMATNFPAIVRKALPPEANTPVLIQKILDVTTLEDLCSMLDNPIHTPTQQSCIYVEIKKRRNVVENRFK